MAASRTRGRSTATRTAVKVRDGQTDIELGSGSASKTTGRLMTTWVRVKFEESCGLCGERIYVNQPALLIELPKLLSAHRRRYRCVDCVGPAPPDLPENIEITPESKSKPSLLKSTAAQFTRGKLSDQDWVNKITGERD